MPAADPDPLGGQWKGFSGPWRGRVLHLARGFQPGAVHQPLARKRADREGQQRAAAILASGTVVIALYRVHRAAGQTAALAFHRRGACWQ